MERGVNGRAPGERVLRGTGGVGGANRKTVVRRSTLREAGADLRREAHVGRATLTAEARLAGKLEKEGALAALKAARMQDPAFWCIAGVDDDEEAEEVAEVGGAGGGAGADAEGDETGLGEGAGAGHAGAAAESGDGGVLCVGAGNAGAATVRDDAAALRKMLTAASSAGLGLGAVKVVGAVASSIDDGVGAATRAGRAHY